MLVKLVQLLNVFVPILVNKVKLDKLMLDKLVQLRNTDVPNKVRLLGNDTDDNAEHPRKALFPIVVKFVAPLMFMDVMVVLFLKASTPISTIL